MEGVLGMVNQKPAGYLGRPEAWLSVPRLDVL